MGRVQNPNGPFPFTGQAMEDTSFKFLLGNRFALHFTFTFYRNRVQRAGVARLLDPGNQ
jgi:hypothetical protein